MDCNQPPQPVRPSITKPRCSTNYCLDLRCLPRNCPKTARGGTLAHRQLQNNFRSFVDFLAANLPSSPENCPERSSTLGTPLLRICNPFDDAQNRHRPFEIHPHRDPAFIGPSNASNVPSGAIIYSFRLTQLNGFYWCQVIYYYQGLFNYMFYNTGISAQSVIKMKEDSSTTSSGQPEDEVASFREHSFTSTVSRIRGVEIREGMSATDLTTLLRCLPDAWQFKQINCLSAELLPSILVLKA